MMHQPGAQNLSKNESSFVNTGKLSKIYIWKSEGTRIAKAEQNESEAITKPGFKFLFIALAVKTYWKRDRPDQ